MDDKMKSYFDKLLLEKEMNEMGTDFASPDDRQSAMYTALQGEMQGMMPDSQEIPMEEVNDIVEAENAPNESNIEDMVREYVSLKQQPQQFQDGGMVEDEEPLDELRLVQGQYEDEMEEKKRGSYEDRQKRAIRRLEDEVDKQYKEDDSDKMLNWLTAIGAAARPLKEPYLPDTGKVNYWGNQRKKQFEDQRKNKIKQLTNLQNMYNNSKKDKDDSKIYQTRSGLVKLDKEGNPIELYKDPSVKTYADARERSQELSEKKFDFKKGETEKERKEKIVKEFNQDPVIRDSKKAIIAADKARSIIETDGKMAPSVMGRLLARMAGEVGVMTDKDVEAFKGSPQWTDSIERFFRRGVQGKLTETDKVEMKKMIDSLADIEQEAVSGYADNLSRQYSRASGLERDTVYEAIMPKVAKEIYKDTNKKQDKDPKIESYSKQNNLSYKQAEKILRSRGYDG